jgi:phosphotriesterase-related protein
VILPHEHLFTDLRGPQVATYARADPRAVVTLLRPFLEDAAARGVVALVECSTVGVGSNLEVLARLADSTPIRIVAPTGVYREAYVPTNLKAIEVEPLADLWTRDLTVGMAGTSVRAGFLKLAVSDEGPTPLEIRNLKAAAVTSTRTGAALGVHTIGGTSARRVMDVLEEAGASLERFVWIHAQTEPDHAVVLEAARRGAFVELDAIGATYHDQNELVDLAVVLIEAGYGGRLLLSHDAGWYAPGTPDGRPEGGFRGYTALITDFLPALLSRGVSPATVRQIVALNPLSAFEF